MFYSKTMIIPKGAGAGGAFNEGENRRIYSLVLMIIMLVCLQISSPFKSPRTK